MQFTKLRNNHQKNLFVNIFISMRSVYPQVVNELKMRILYT